MFLKLTDNFYQLTDVFSETTLTALLEQFDDKSSWICRPRDATTDTRLEGPLPFEIDVYSELNPLVEQIVKTKLYPNGPSLWYDPPGYVNLVHQDLSPDLAVNVQIYLTDGDSAAGTHCYDNESWYSVPYQKNSGYLLIGPTQLLHGMRAPTTVQRLSLYQSYRTTKEPANIW